MQMVAVIKKLPEIQYSADHAPGFRTTLVSPMESCLLPGIRASRTPEPRRSRAVIRNDADKLPRSCNL